MVEGTVKIGYGGDQPLTEPPPERMTLVEGKTPSGSMVRIDVDEQMQLHWVREAPGREVADVAVDLTPLIGAKRLDIWCTWSPLRIDVHVVDRDRPSRFVTSETTEGLTRFGKPQRRMTTIADTLHPLEVDSAPLPDVIRSKDSVTRRLAAASSTPRELSTSCKTQTRIASMSTREPGTTCDTPSRGVWAVSR
jgi:hypothetical protein